MVADDGSVPAGLGGITFPEEGGLSVVEFGGEPGGPAGSGRRSGLVGKDSGADSAVSPAMHHPYSQLKRVPLFSNGIPESGGGE